MKGNVIFSVYRGTRAEQATKGIPEPLQIQSQSLPLVRIGKHTHKNSLKSALKRFDKKHFLI